MCPDLDLHADMIYRPRSLRYPFTVSPENLIIGTELISQIDFSHGFERKQKTS